MNLLLDTNIFLWYISGDLAITENTKKLLRDPANDVFVSVASIWEAVIKYKLGKLPLPESPEIFLPRQRIAHGFLSLPITESVLRHLPDLPTHHKDPFDRILICQALDSNLTIVTSDTTIPKYSVSTVGA